MPPIAARPATAMTTHTHAGTPEDFDRLINGGAEAGVCGVALAASLTDCPPNGVDETAAVPAAVRAGVLDAVAPAADGVLAGVAAEPGVGGVAVLVAPGRGGALVPTAGVAGVGVGGGGAGVPPPPGGSTVCVASCCGVPEAVRSRCVAVPV